MNNIRIAKTGLFVSFVLCLTFFYAGCTTHPAPSAQNGVIDLTQWDFKKDGEARLDGTWNFYWKKLLSQQQIKGSDRIIKSATIDLPSVWNNKVLDGKQLHCDGFATLSLIVKLKNIEQAELGVLFLGINSVYKLWINGKLIAENGDPVREDTAETFRFHYHRLIGFKADNNTLHFVLQVSNHTNTQGGVVASILLGDYEQMIQNKTEIEYFGLFVNGSFLGLGLFFFLLFIQRRSDFFYFLMTAFCFLWTVNLSCRWFREIYFDFWFFFNQIEAVSFYFTIPCLILFLSSFFPKERILLLDLISLGLATVFSGLAIFASPKTLNSQFDIYLGLILIFMVYGLVIVGKAFYHKREDSRIILTGILILVVVSLLDIFVYYSLKGTEFLSTYALALFAFTVSISVSKRFSRAYANINDLSETLKEKNKSLFKLDKLKDEFLANTTHELKTPLHGIIGLTDALLKGAKGKIDTEVKHDLGLISTSGKRLSNLIDDILDYSKLQAGEMKLELRPVFLRPLIEVVIELSSQLIGEKPLQLSIEVPDDLPPVVANEHRLQQILFNLVGNAIKYTESGSVIVSGRVVDGQMEITVKDTGIGIPADKLSEIFNPFERLNRDEIESLGGTGIGLYIARQLAALHGSEIKVVSDLEKGSIFSLNLAVTEQPVEDQVSHSKLYTVNPESGNQQIATSFQLDALTESGNKANPDTLVYIVDDEAVNRTVLQNYLSLAQIETRSFPDGQSVLESLEPDNFPDLILLDIMMPKMNGYEVCKEIRLSYSQNELPVIMLTANQSEENLKLSFKCGANDYISKPFSSDELISRTIACLKMQQGYRALKENLLLKKELTLRLKTEKELLNTQRMLAEMLNKLDAPVVAFNESDEISFYNNAFKQLIGYQRFDENLLGAPLASLFTSRSIEHLKQWKSKSLAQHLPLFSENRKLSLRKTDHSLVKRPAICQVLELDEENQYVVIVKSDQESQHAKKIPFPLPELVEELNRNRQWLLRIKDSVGTTSNKDQNQASQIFSDIKSIENSLDSMNATLSEDDEERLHRDWIVKAVKLSLDLWHESTGLTKADLALKSGLWNIYTDINGWQRTQTLDKYLNPKTLPKYPQIKKVVDTALFVTGLFEGESDPKKELSEIIKKLNFLY